MRAKSIQKGATIPEARRNIRVEITSMGATQKRAATYVNDCIQVGFIDMNRTTLKLKITQKGLEFLNTRGV